MTNLQTANPLSSFCLRSKIFPPEKLLVFSFEQGIARAGFREDEERHLAGGSKCRLRDASTWKVNINWFSWMELAKSRNFRVKSKSCGWRKSLT